MPRQQRPLRRDTGPPVAVLSALAYSRATERLCREENGRSGVRASRVTIYTISVVRHKSKLLCRCPRSELFVPRLNVITLITIKLSDHILGSYEEQPSVQSTAERLRQTQTVAEPQRCPGWHMLLFHFLCLTKRLLKELKEVFILASNSRMRFVWCSASCFILSISSLSHARTCATCSFSYRVKSGI